MTAKQEIFSSAEYFHRQTNYHPESIASHPPIDPEQQPPLFKEYRGAERIELANLLPMRPFVESLQPQNEEIRTHPLAAISRLLFATNGVTAVGNMGPEKHFFRASPSAGALYPSEVYLIIGEHEGVKPGVHNFHVRDHALQRISNDSEALSALGEACFEHPAFEVCQLAIVLSTYFQRSSWRYGQRAYRRVMLDTGHVAGNLVAAAPVEDYRALLIGGFFDRDVDDLIGIDGVEERSCLVIPLVPAGEATFLEDAPVAQRSSPFSTLATPEPNDLLRTLASQSTITRADRAMAIQQEEAGLGERIQDYRFNSSFRLNGDSTDLQDEILTTILRRRSARMFTGQPASFHQLRRVLEYAYERDEDSKGKRSPLTAGLIESWVVVHDAQGIDAGIYALNEDDGLLNQVEAGEFRHSLHFLCLHQELALMASAIVIHTCDLRAAVDRFGNRAYRYLHLDAGYLGQRMALAALHEGLGTSGIGGFFDEHVNDLLALGEQHVCLYITCIGDPA